MIWLICSAKTRPGKCNMALTRIPVPTLVGQAVKYPSVGVNANFLAHMIQKIATKRVYQSKAQAEAIAGRRAQTRLNTRMDTQSLNLVAQGNRDFWAKFRNPLTRVGAFPEQMHFSSWGDRLMVRATNRAGDSQPAEAVWNPGGYLRNVIEHVDVSVE